MILLRRRFDADDRRVISILIHSNILFKYYARLRTTYYLLVSIIIITTLRWSAQSNRLPRNRGSYFYSQRRVWQCGSVFDGLRRPRDL